MPETVLVIGDKRLSSWSLRPWLFLRHHGVPFREVCVRLDRPETREEILQHSPSGKVPCLVHGSIRVWESIAICDTAVELFKLRDAWPVEPEARALARALAAEMHAGFPAIRREFPFDATRIPQTQAPSAEAAVEIARVAQIWREARSRFGKDGDWLFGKFGIVDAMYAPVAVRFHKYGVQLDGPERDYVKNVLNMPALREWLGAALLEADPAEAAPLPAAPAAQPPRAAEPPPAAPVPAEAAPAPAPTPARAVPSAAEVAASILEPDIDESEMPPVPKRRSEPRKPEAPLAPGQIRSKIIPP